MLFKLNIGYFILFRPSVTAGSEPHGTVGHVFMTVTFILYSNYFTLTEFYMPSGFLGIKLTIIIFKINQISIYLYIRIFTPNRAVFISYYWSKIVIIIITIKKKKIHDTPTFGSRSVFGDRDTFLGGHMTLDTGDKKIEMSQTK